MEKVIHGKEKRPARASSPWLMMIVDLPAHDRMTPDQALALASREQWSHVIICGYHDGDESLVVRSSHVTREFSLWIAEHLKQHILGAE